MISSLSILIPVYNCKAVRLVEKLSAMAAVSNIGIEIIVADDGSSDLSTIEANKIINKFAYSRFIEHTPNVGRSAIRNFLVSQAVNEWLLFIDGDMNIDSDLFLKNYIENATKEVVYGGYRLPISNETLLKNLRYKYEKSSEHIHCVDNRRLKPYHDFHTSNFLVCRDVMLQIPFDEQYRQYGYEDVFWGKELQNHNIGIAHINNPVLFDDFEDNSSFLSKTKEGLCTLFEHKDQLYDFSRLIVTATRVRKYHLDKCLLGVYKLFARLMERNLRGNNPSLLIFKLYRLGYFLSLY